MRYKCQSCGIESKNIEGPEVWARECGFYELSRLQHVGCLSGYSVCSKQCAANLLSTLMKTIPEVKPSGNASRTWKCEQCGEVLPQHIYQPKGAECETVPFCSQLSYPNEWGTYHCFCSDACLMANLKSEQL